MKKTALYDEHEKLGGKIVEFAGYLLPVQYETGVIAEHMAVREKAGLFDVSHMGEVHCEGTDALANLNYIMTNDFTNMENGQVRYTVMCYEDGGCIDDLLVYKYRDNDYYIIPNASNAEKDFKWMRDHQFGDCQFTDISDSVSQIALQGPNAIKIMEKLGSSESAGLKYYRSQFFTELQVIPCVISRTGYTGEDGFEIYVFNENAVELWNLLLEAGEEFGLIPCGLGARDTLRLEASMPLYGHEMSEKINPIEAGLGLGVKMDKEDFIGKSALPTKEEAKRKRVGLKVTGRGIVREHMDLMVDGKKVGETTSGTKAPYLNEAIAMALVSPEYAEVGTKLTALVRGREIECEVVKMPFYKRK